MIERSYLEELSRKQSKIKQMQSELDNEFQKYRQELFQRAKEVLKWKDDNLGQEFLKYKTRGYIHELRSNSIVLCLPDIDAEFPAQYYNVSFDEIYSDDWKEIALKEYENKIQEKRKEEQLVKEKALVEKEIRERLEYERLKAKYEQTSN